jgi:predicted membrane protein
MTDWDRDSKRDSASEARRDSTGDGTRDAIHNNINDRIRHGHRNHPAHGIIVGAIVCTVGLVLLLDHMGLISADRLWRLWPVLLVFAGVGRLGVMGKRAWGAMLILFGVLLLLQNFDVFHLHWGDLWPLVIICVGLVMIWNAIEARRVRGRVSHTAEDVPTMNATAVFGGVERRISARDFRRGTLTAVFGGAEIDFRDADMDGAEATLEVNAIFGGAEIRVPESWAVEFHGQTIFGGYSDKTRMSVPADPAGFQRKTLFITGATCFGGVEVKN